MKSLILATIAAVSLCSCTREIVKNSPKAYPECTTVGLKNPGTVPGQNFGDAGATRCSTRTTVQGMGMPWCPQPPLVGDENDPRNMANQVQ